MKRALIFLLIFLAACAPPEKPEIPEPEQQEAPFEDVPLMPPPPEELPAPEPAQEEITGQAAPEPEVQTIPVGSEVQCPEGYLFAGGYCVEDACQDKQVKCMVSGSLIKRPDCECWIYLGEPICSIKAAEETRVKSPLCQRKGQAGAVCGAYDSNKKHCVLK